MALPEHGRPADEVLAELSAMRVDDVPWREGRTFGLVYDGGPEVHEVAEAASEMFLHENALNTFAFPSLAQCQREVCGAMGELLSGGDKAAGFLTSGGTESILMAVKAARERGRSERNISAPEMVLANSAHAAFHKAAYDFGLTTVTVPVKSDFTADVDAMADSITDNTVLVVGSAPQYPQGVIDPIPELASLAADIGASFHTDACMGGFILPFMEKLGHDVPAWDFRVPGVTTISLDVHKLGYSPKGASIILHRDKHLRRYQTFSFDAWLGGFYASPNQAGSRPGGPMAAAWAVMNRLGLDGYMRLTQQTIEAADRMRAGVRAIDGLRVVGDPSFHLLAIAADDPAAVDVFAVADDLKVRGGWHLDRQNDPDALHATVCVNNAPHIDAFLTDLAAAVAEVGSDTTADRDTSYSNID